MMGYPMRSPRSGPAHQGGVALFISLVLLLVLTIIGVSAVQTTSLDERMARNSRDRMLAFQAAESALRDAETFIETVTTTAIFTDTGANGLWTVAPFGTQPRLERPTLWTGAESVVAATNLAGIAAPPRYVIEHVASLVREDNAYLMGDPYGGSSVDRIEILRVTARGVGGSTNAQVLLQSTYGRVLE
jgi:type IV pilus assembly protein PilX